MCLIEPQKCSIIHSPYHFESIPDPEAFVARSDKGVASHPKHCIPNCGSASECCVSAHILKQAATRLEKQRKQAESNHSGYQEVDHQRLSKTGRPVCEQ